MKLLTKPSINVTLIILSVIAGFILFVQPTVDDAFICFRYGYNLVNYGIWNWNIDNERAEAYTSFTYMLLSIIPPFLKVQPQYIFKIVSFIFFLLIIRRVLKSSKNIKLNLLVAVLFTCNWQTHVHTYSGLETIFWFWLLIEFFFSITENKSQIWLWFLALLLPLTRPEGALFSAFLLVYLVFIKKEKINIVAFLFFVGLGLVYFYWRYTYFGLLLPLPFYHKTLSQSNKLFNFILNSIISWQYLVFAIYLLIISIKKKLHSSYFLFLSIFIFFFSYAISTLHMNYASRFPFQILYPAIIFALFTIFNSEEFHSKEKLKFIKIIFIFLFINLFTGIFSVLSFTKSTIKDNILKVFWQERAYTNVGKHFHKLKPLNTKVLLLDIGGIGYYSELKCYDYLGLAEPYLAKNKIDKTYFDKADADIIIYSGVENALLFVPKKSKINQFVNTNMSDIYNLMVESAKYEKITGSVIFVKGLYHLYFYVKRDTPHHDEIVHQIKSAIKYSDEYKFNYKSFFKLKFIGNSQ